MTKTAILVQYHGVVRLLLRRKDDTFTFNTSPNVENVIAAIAAKHGAEAAAMCRRQLFVRYQPESAAGKVIGLQDTLTDGDVLIIASLITGG